MDQENDSPSTFSAGDYVVFALVFVVSSCVGIFYAIRDAKRKSSGTDEYLLAKRKMHYIPVALSLMVSFMSAITILGNAAEVYTFGMMVWWLVPAFFIAACIISEIYIPVFYRLNITSSYEYLEKRFNRVIRVLVTAAFIAETIMYAGIVIYAPSLALQQVTGLDRWAAVLSTGLVCTFYTTLGGLKGVIWTDVFQAIVMLSGLLAVVIRGSVVVDGGFAEIWKISGEGGRLNMAITDPDPRVRHSIWTLLVGGTFLWLGLYAVSQSQVQRYLCCRNERESKMALFLNAFGLFLVITLTCLTGLVIYARYETCDLIDTRFGLSARDRLLPYMVMDILRDYPGVPGIFVACVFSGGLSTISTGINAMACVTVEDFIKPCTKWTGKTYGWISRGLGIFYGLACVGMAFLASGGVLQAAISIFGIVGGPLIGVYTLGILFPFANSWGASSGLILGLVSTSWLYQSASTTPMLNRITNILERDTSGCPVSNASTVEPTASYASTVALNTTLSVDVESPLTNFYSVSYLYYGCIGFAVTSGIGIIVSLISGGWKVRKQVDRKLLRPPFDHWLFRSWIPESVRKVLRFGIEWTDNPAAEIGLNEQCTRIESISDSDRTDTKESGEIL